MENLLYQPEPPLACPLGPMMVDHHRRYQPEPTHFWTADGLVLPRFKRRPSDGRKKTKGARKSENLDIEVYAQHGKDKYGSVSAHSTSAIYGALRAPHYHAVYGPPNVWYSSVRSLNRGFARDPPYPVEGYEWREPLYEEAFSMNPKCDVLPHLSCCSCKSRNKRDQVKSRNQPRCNYCANGPYSVNASLDEPKKNNINKSKISVSEEITNNKPGSSFRMSAYKKCVTGATKCKMYECRTKDPRSSRKSILECEVSAYDLIQDSKVPPIHENEESVIDDNLSVNSSKRINKSTWLKTKSKYASPTGSSRQIANKYAPKHLKSQNGNETHSELSSKLHSDQRPFSDSQSDNTSDLLFRNSPYNVPCDRTSEKWQSVPDSDMMVIIPDPDYDFSDDSDGDTVITCRYRDPKFTYSPPTTRRSNSPHNPLGSREISKSMSSLVSDDTYVPSENENCCYRQPEITNASSKQDCDTCDIQSNVDKETFSANDIDQFVQKDEELPHEGFVINESKYESSSSCSSSAGTISSDYPTWTSSSSNELKSILKNKRSKRTKQIHKAEEYSREFLVSREAQKKKQVQFLTGGIEFNNINDKKILIDDEKYINNQESAYQDNSVITCDTYETIPDSAEEEFKALDISDTGMTTQLEELSVEGQPHSGIDSYAEPSSDFESLGADNSDKILPHSSSVFYVSIDDNLVPERKIENERQFSPNNVAPSDSEDFNESLFSNKQLDICDIDENFYPDEDIIENEYEHVDPIYEELSDVSSTSKRVSDELQPTKSFFEGASRTEILSYLEGAKERGISEVLSEDEEKVLGVEEDFVEKNLVNEKNSINQKTVLLSIEEDNEKEDTEETEKNEEDITKVERNDSGVGTETSKPPRMKAVGPDVGSDEEQLCADCDRSVEAHKDERSGLLVPPLVCRECERRRAERKEALVEFVDTELKYGRDLRIVKEEFYRPMEVAGLLVKDQLISIFLNLDELILANMKLSEKLQDALDIAVEHGDEDFTTVNLGKIFLETSSMLHAFETYCVKQAPASLLLSSMEKEKELLRIFLRVSQMENTLLRRMNLPAFLMVPVQRVTRYPLLLSRLHKVTPIHHRDRSALKEAQQKVELHLEHINQQTKGVGGTKIWRRISNISASHRRLGKDIGNIKLRKMALEVLKWKQDETRFVMAEKLLVAPITDYPWNKKGRSVKFSPAHALLIALGKPNANYRPDSPDFLFPRNTGIRDASLVLMKEKNSRFTTLREPLFLGNCVISCDTDCDDVFEIQEYTTKEAYLLKGETKKETKDWLRLLRYHAKDLGSWRKRRNALANIMINGMVRQ